jgi:hypothetical protein
MRSSFIAMVFTLATCASAHATSTVSFEAEGYILDIVIGNDSRPAVAGLGFAAPGSVRSIEIPLRHLSIDAFDAKQKILLLRFTNPADPALPRDFSLAVRNDVGVLKIEGRPISGRFSWGM